MVIPFLLGAGVGYVLGTRAGRERYEQLSRAYRRVADHPERAGSRGCGSREGRRGRPGGGGEGPRAGRAHRWSRAGGAGSRHGQRVARRRALRPGSSRAQQRAEHREDAAEPEPGDARVVRWVGRTEARGELGAQAVPRRVVEHPAHRPQRRSRDPVADGIVAGQRVQVRRLPAVHVRARPRAGEQPGVLLGGADAVRRQALGDERPTTPGTRAGRGRWCATARPRCPAPGSRASPRPGAPRPSGRAGPGARAPSAAPRCSPRRRSPGPARSRGRRRARRRPRSRARRRPCPATRRRRAPGPRASAARAPR